MLNCLVLVMLAQVCMSGAIVSTLQAQPCFTTPGVFSLECVLLTEQKRVKESPMKFALEPVLPCSCKTVFRLLDLGQGYFPRYLPSVDCSEGSCWRGLYRCHHRYYDVKVLKTKDKVDDSTYMHDFSLPESLREMWKFVQVKVVVGCECSL